MPLLSRCAVSPSFRSAIEVPTLVLACSTMTILQVTLHHASLEAARCCRVQAVAEVEPQHEPRRCWTSPAYMQISGESGGTVQWNEVRQGMLPWLAAPAPAPCCVATTCLFAQCCVHFLASVPKPRAYFTTGPGVCG